MEKHVDNLIRQVYSILLSKPNLRPHVDLRHGIPKIYRGEGQIKLVIIGQDPTVKNKASRRNINTVLNLDKPGKLQRYVSKICSLLDIDPVSEIYATNLIKNFFEEPPGDDKEVFSKFSRFWVPVLLKELEPYKNVPVITLGDVVLGLMFNNGQKNLVRNFWGYHEEWKTGLTLPFSHCPASQNIIGRKIFPFPHQPSIAKDFYAARFDSYVSYMREKLILTEATGKLRSYSFADQA